MKILPTAALRANLASPDMQVVGNVRVLLDDRDQLVKGLVVIAQALDALVPPPRRVCVACRCLLLPRDRRCPGCDAKAGRHLEHRLKVG